MRAVCGGALDFVAVAAAAAQCGQRSVGLVGIQGLGRALVKSAAPIAGEVEKQQRARNEM
jgi:hypothetical protein